MGLMFFMCMGVYSRVLMSAAEGLTVGGNYSD